MSTPTKNRLFKLFCFACACLIARLDADEGLLDVSSQQTQDVDLGAALQDEQEDLDFVAYEDPEVLALMGHDASFDAYAASILAAFDLEEAQNQDPLSAGHGAEHAQLEGVAVAADVQAHRSLSEDFASQQDWSVNLPDELMVFGDAGLQVEAPAELPKVDLPVSTMPEVSVAAAPLAAPATPAPVVAAATPPAPVPPAPDSEAIVFQETPAASPAIVAPAAPVPANAAPAAQPAVAVAAAPGAPDPFSSQTAAAGQGDLEAIFKKDTGPVVTKGEQDTISVDYSDTTIRGILRNVADIYGLNLVIPDALVGNISVKLNNVTWRQVFDVVLESAHFKRVEDGNIVKIKSREEVMTEPTDTSVFILNHGKAEELKVSIASLVDETRGGKLQIDKRANALIITERPSRLNSIYTIIKKLDQPEPQVMIESKFIDTTNTDVFKLGMSYSPVITGSATKPQRSAARTNTYIRNAEQPVALQNPGTNLQTIFTDTAIFSLDTFQATLNMLSTDGKSKIINNPTVVTLNNTPASISVGTRTPIPNYTYNEQRGAYEVSGFNYLDLGTILKVEPHVNTAGFITMSIKPEVSNKGAPIAFSTNATIPEIESIRTESVVTLKDGYTVAIGGLVQKTNKKNKQSVPILGNIPIIGDLLFKSRDNNNTDRNIIIFITARALNPDGTSYEETTDPRVMYEMGIKPSDLPGYTLPEQTLQKMKALQQEEESRASEELNARIELHKACIDSNSSDYRKMTQKMKAIEKRSNLQRRRTQQESNRVTDKTVQ